MPCVRQEVGRMIEWESLESPYRDQMLILKRICIRGRSMFYARRDSKAMDMFEHLETEIGRLAVQLAEDSNAKQQVCSV